MDIDSMIKNAVASRGVATSTPEQPRVLSGQDVDLMVSEAFAPPKFNPIDMTGLSADEQNRAHHAAMKKKAADDVMYEIRTGKYKADPVGFFTSLDETMGLKGDTDLISASLAMRRLAKKQYPDTPQGRLAKAEDEANAYGYQAAGQAAEARKAISSTFGRIKSGMASIVSEAPLFAATFYLTGPAYGVGRTAARKAATKVLERGAEKFFQRETGKAAMGFAGRQAVNLAGALGGTALRTPLIPQLVTAEYFRERLPEVSQTAEGKLIFDDRNTPGFMEAMGRAFGKSFIENLSEMSGEVLTKIPKKAGSWIIGDKASAALKAVVVDKWLARLPGRTVADAAKKLAGKTGWHGLLGEIGEEELGKALKGLTTLEEYKVTTPEEFASEALGLALYGGALHGVTTAAAKLETKAQQSRAALTRSVLDDMMQNATREAVEKRAPEYTFDMENVTDLLEEIEAHTPIAEQRFQPIVTKVEPLGQEPIPAEATIQSTERLPEAVPEAPAEAQPVAPVAAAEAPPSPSEAAVGPEAYRGEHEAPTGEFGAGSLDAMDRTYPADVYSDDAADVYGDKVDRNSDEKAASLIRSLRGKPEAKIKIYRAVPKGVQPEIKPGDWVTPIREYAVSHGERFDEFNIIEREVAAGELFTEGSSLFEFGWQPKVAALPTALQTPSQQAYAIPAFDALRKMNAEQLRFVATRAGIDGTGTRGQVLGRLTEARKTRAAGQPAAEPTPAPSAKGEPIPLSDLADNDLVKIGGEWHRVKATEGGDLLIGEGDSVQAGRPGEGMLPGVQAHVKHGSGAAQEQAEKELWEQQQRKKAPQNKPDRVPAPQTMKDVDARDKAEKETRKTEDAHAAETGEVVQGLFPKPSTTFTQSAAVVRVTNTFTDLESKQQVVDVVDNESGMPLGQFFVKDLKTTYKKKWFPGLEVIVTSDKVPIGYLAEQNTHKVIRRNTGMTDTSRDLTMTERQYLKRLLSSNERVSKDAYRQGRKEGWLDAAMTYRQAIQAATRLRQQRADFHKMKNAIIKIRNRVNEMPGEVRDEIIAIVDEIDWKSTALKRQRLHEAALARFLGKAPAAKQSAVLRRQLDRLNQRPAVGIDYEDMKEIYMEVQRLDALAREMKAETNAEQARKDKYIAEREMESMPRKSGRKTDEPGGPVDVRNPSLEKTVGDKIRGWWYKSNDRFMVMRRLGEGGKYIMGKLLSAADSVFHGTRKQYTVKLQDYVKANPWILEWMKRPYALRYRDGTPEGGLLTITQDQKLALFMHTFNAEATKNLEEGGICFKGLAGQIYSIPRESIEQVIQDVAQHPEQIKLADFLWREINDSLFTKAMQVFRKVTGYDIPGVNFYLTLNVANPNSTLDQIQAVTQAYVERVYGPKSVSLDKGWTMKRTGAVNPIYLTGAIDQTANHIERMAEYIGYEEWLHRANKYLTNPDIQKAMLSRLGEADARYWDKLVRDVSDQKYDRELNDNLLDYLSRTTTVGMLWGMVTTMFKQYASYFSAAEILGADAWNPALFSQAFKNVTLEGEACEAYWKDKSDFLWSRKFRGFSTESQDVRRRGMLARVLTGRREGVFHAFKRGLMSDYAGPDTKRLGRFIAGSREAIRSMQELGMAGIDYNDFKTVLMVAEMARLKYMKDRGLGIDMSAKQEQLMVEYAEDIVRRSQAASSYVDRAEMLRSRNRALKLLAPFMSSVTKDMGAITRVITDESKPLVYRTALAGLMFGSISLFLGGVDEMGDLLFGKPDDEKGLLGVKQEDPVPLRLAKRAGMNAIYSVPGSLYLANILTRGFIGWLQYGRAFPISLPAFYAAERGQAGVADVLSGLSEKMDGEDGGDQIAKGTVRIADAVSLGLLGLPGVKIADKLLAMIANLQGEAPEKLEKIVQGEE